MTTKQTHKRYRKHFGLTKKEYGMLVSSGFTVREHVEMIPMQMDEILTVMRRTGESSITIVKCGDIHHIDLTRELLLLITKTRT